MGGADPRLPAEWRDRLDELARSRGLATHEQLGVLGPALREVSDAYNGGDFRLPWTPARLAARLHFFLVRDQAKVVAALRDLVVPGAWRGDGPPLRVVDVGAGIGASALGVVRALRGHGVTRALELHLLDTDAAALAVAAEVLGGCAGVRVTLGGGMPDRVDLACFAAVLVEVAGGATAAEGDARCTARVNDAVRRLLPGGRVVVVEPALRESTRRLMRVRDVLAAGGAHVHAPCPHDGPCAMLGDARDWCHDDVDVDLPAWTQALARAAGLRWQGLTFARLVLGAEPVARPAFRVVAPPRDSRGRRERQLCGALPDGRTLVWVDRLEKHHTEANAAFAELQRGDGVDLEPASARVGPDCRVTRG